MIEDEKLGDMLRLCAACPKMCRHVCPTFLAWRSDSPTPHGRALVLYQENEGVRKLDERAIEVLYQCLECSHCFTWCKPEVDIAAIVEQTRVRLVEDGDYPRGLDTLRESIAKNHNPFSEPHENRNTWLYSKDNNDAKVLYFTGCTAVYREKEIARDTVEVLEYLNYQVEILSDEYCCGSPLLRTGFRDDAEEVAKHNSQLLNSSDAKMIVVTCPGCYRVLSEDYPKLGYVLNKPVIHLSQFLEKHLENIPPLKMTRKLTYHDPCHLGRHMGVYLPPRSIIESIARDEFVEMERNRDDATCCGNGAGMRMLFTEKAKIIGEKRVEDASNVGADIIVTACPFCKNMLDARKSDGMSVIDLPELVLKALKGKE